jgi:hypothetical protein
MTKQPCIGEFRKSRATHTMDSGMGGRFDVRIRRDYGDTCDVIIDMPRNPDWEGVVYDNISKLRLTSLRGRKKETC